MRWFLLCTAMFLLAPGCNGSTTDVIIASLDDDDDGGDDGGDVEVPSVASAAATRLVHQYDEAPRTPDADDPAIWVPRNGDHAPLVLGGLKEGGLEVYDLAG